MKEILTTIMTTLYHHPSNPVLLVVPINKVVMVIEITSDGQRCTRKLLPTNPMITVDGIENTNVGNTRINSRQPL